MQSILDQALDMQEDTQHRALPSGQATLNAEQILALQPELPPVQFCSAFLKYINHYLNNSED
jgi:hypothetical protein